MKRSYLVLLAAVFIYTFDNSYACTLSENQERRKTLAVSLEKRDICEVISSIVWGKEVITAFRDQNAFCSDGVFHASEGVVEVTTGNIPDFPIFDISITAPSINLSKMITWGFESQRYRLMFMLDLGCQNKLWLQDVESRVIRADWSIAVNERNPNWELIADGDAQFGLNQRIEEALKGMLVQKLATPSL